MKFCALTERLVSRLGHSTASANSGSDALRLARENHYDLVLVNIFLPDMNGLELIPKLKELYPKMSIITMAAHNTKEMEASIRKLGIIYYMSKPFPATELKSVLDHLTDKDSADLD